MAGAAHTQAYKDLLNALVQLRKEAGLSQAELAKRLRKPPSYVGKYELGERRLDIIETMIVIEKLGSSFEDFWRTSGIQLPE
ncbi:helix-turn-helix transcriptional regulator [Dinoroseobacter sp. S375]|uniref:helix-turn-helix transcriptional regulator n=1 Tax=Dinoroseobacter sp. S375 TaxID=3415136 RepID=UPI003C79C388